MKQELLTLIDELDYMKTLFHDNPDQFIVGVPLHDLIYDKDEFNIWIQKIKYELQNVTVEKPLINETLEVAQKKFDGWHDRKYFRELEAKLIVIRDNIDDFYINVEETGENNQKSLKIFISHSSNDEKYIKDFIDLFEFMGLSTKEIFCSSVPGYGVGLNEDIIEYLLSQFENNKLHIIYVLSNNYYQSCYTLNEMGAAWVLKNKHTTFLLPGFDFKDIDGVLNKNRIAIKLDDNIDRVKDNLNQFYDVIANEFDLERVPGIRWENKRDEFIDKINKK